jgi:hypothetical protein
VREAIHERLAHDPRAGKRLAGVRDAFSDAEVWVLVARVGAPRS